MDITATLGFIIGIFCLILGFSMDGGHISSLFSLSAGLIVFGGTIGATMLSFSTKEVLRIPKLLSLAFKKEESLDTQTIEYLVRLSGKARSQGLLSLEGEIQSSDMKKFDPIMQDCLELVVDGTDTDIFKTIVENKITCEYMANRKNAEIFETAGGYSPTMGIIGTVMGLVHVLGNLSEPEKLGPAIAVAFIATLYGVSSANLFWLPVGQKLKNMAAKQRMYQELIVEGTVSIQEGENPLILHRKLNTFLTEKIQQPEQKNAEDREVHEAA